MIHYLDSFSPENLIDICCKVEYYTYDEEGTIIGTATETCHFHVWPGTDNSEIESMICEEIGIESEDIIDWSK